jgi:hypothetical protein
MPVPYKYGVDIRKAMQDDYEKGMNIAEIARKHGVGYSTATKIITVERTEYAIVEKPGRNIPKGFEKAWNDARYRLLGIRPGWIDEWNEARERLLKGARV